jgi:hypothetical protein
MRAFWTRDQGVERPFLQLESLIILATYLLGKIQMNELAALSCVRSLNSRMLVGSHTVHTTRTNT